MSDRYPVFVSVARDGGGTEQVRVGWAVKSAEGFTLSFDSMSIGASAAPAPRGASTSRAAPASRPAGGGGGMLFPNYGRSKGMPVAGASMGDLEFYANGCRRTLADPGKSRWHDKERELLAAIEAEIERQRGGGGGGFDDGVPPPTDADRGPGDDDAPF
jgi:hypothetical protein